MENNRRGIKSATKKGQIAKISNISIYINAIYWTIKEKILTLFTGYNASDIYVIAGDHNIDIADGEEKYNAKQVIIHPKYGENDGYHFNYDACLLEVDPISLDGKTKGTVCLPESGAHIEATIDEFGNKVKNNNNILCLKQMTFKILR